VKHFIKLLLSFYVLYVHFVAELFFLGLKITIFLNNQNLTINAHKSPEKRRALRRRDGFASWHEVQW